MIAPDDFMHLVQWTPRELPPVADEDFYARWEREQRDRWDIEAFARVQEMERARRGRRDALGIVSLLLGLGLVLIALTWGGVP